MLRLPFLNRKPTISDAAREMAARGPIRQKLEVRARVDEMRKNLGLPPAEWGPL